MLDAIFRARNWEMKQSEVMTFTDHNIKAAPDLKDEDEVKRPKVDVLWLHKM